MKKQRYRIRFSKMKPMRYTGHLDLIQTWERVFRRAGIPLAYSEGFSPRPLLNLAAPLPLGFISSGEIGDFWLSDNLTHKELSTKLSDALPPGLSIQDIQEVQDLYGSKLPSLVVASSYSITLPKPAADLRNKIDSLMQSSSITIERKRKSIDLRSLIKNLVLCSEKDQPEDILLMTLTALPGATGRPDEVLNYLDIDPGECLICRTNIHLQGDEE
jgi:radical SAM-linked protein